MGVLIWIHQDNPAERAVKQVVEILQNGGVIIYPTDTVYGLGCDITKPRAVERVAQLKGVKVEKANFSFICENLSHLSDYTKPISNSVFKMMKRNLPGPFTFILEANSNVPKILKQNRKTVGIRVPANKIITDIVRMLGNPILTTSLRIDDEIVEYPTDPELIYEEYKNRVDAVIDGGAGGLIASTVIDCTGPEIEIIRHGSVEPDV